MHMHHPALSKEFKFGISAKGKAMKPVKLVNNPSMIDFRRDLFAAENLSPSPSTRSSRRMES